MSAGEEQDRSARGAMRSNRRLELEWVLIPALVAFVFLIVFGAKLLLG